MQGSTTEPVNADSTLRDTYGEASPDAAKHPASKSASRNGLGGADIEEGHHIAVNIEQDDTDTSNSNGKAHHISTHEAADAVSAILIDAR